MSSNLKEIKDRITSIDSVIKITNVMKMVAASKIKINQKIISNITPYFDNFKKIIYDLLSLINVNNNINNNNKNILFIIITSNRGLCGSFNFLIISKINLLLKKYKKNISLLTIGIKGNDFFKKKNFIYDNWDFIFDKISFYKFSIISEKLIFDLLNYKFKNVKVIYTKFINSNNYKVVVKDLFPIILNDDYLKKRKNYYVFEPCKEKIYKSIISKYLKLKIYKYILNSNLSENYFRMISMHKATENALELKKKLNYKYNNLRQYYITKDMLEIISNIDSF